jgi:hypothetical protein
MSGANPRLYLYGIAGAAAAQRSLRRLNDGIIAIVSERVAAFARWMDPTDVVPSEDALWRHETVCEALMKDGPVLPARFGTTFTTPQDVELALRAREGALVAALARVTNRVELGIRVFLLAPSEGAVSSSSEETPGAGRAYLERRRAAEEEKRAAATLIHDALAPLAAESSRQSLTTPQGVMTGAYLVDVSGVDAFRRRVGALEAELAQVRIICTGPWPPYSFVSEDPVG